MTTQQIATTRPALPPSQRLEMTFDADRLVADLRRLSRRTWLLQRSFADDGTITEAEIDWRCCSLRSVGGDPERTDPGGPGLDEFADTPWLRSAPYLSHVLSSIPAQLRSARLLALGPGVASWEHNDTKYGPAWGTARLHIPITTTPGAILYLEGQANHWKPGEFWFADFSRMHRVENTDSVTRVHLVVDALFSQELLQLFPAEYRAQLTLDDFLINRDPVALSPAEAALFRVHVELPCSFVDWEEEGGSFIQDTNRFTATIETCGSRVILLRDGRPILGLAHLGDGEFRFVGWTDERTLQITQTHGGSSVTLRTRRGKHIHELRLAAQPLDPVS
jgi:Aspartyl/Asparaginyl beta-hydroxylase